MQKLSPKTQLKNISLPGELQMGKTRIIHIIRSIISITSKLQNNNPTKEINSASGIILELYHARVQIYLKIPKTSQPVKMCFF